MLLVAVAIAACNGKEEPPGETGASPAGGGDDTGGPVYDPDMDHDGWPASQDCDDYDGTVHPEADEVCDGADNDCDGEVDEGWDADGDGHLPAGDCPDGDDCDEADPSVHGGAEETPYDGVDQDCDGADLTDVDGDGFDGAEVGGNDCDDGDASVHPGAPEVAKDGIDQDCDGADDLDGDGDGFDDEAYGGDDCDDADPSVNPDAIDLRGDDVDADCDGQDGARLDLADAPATIDGTSGQQDYVGFSIAACDLDGDGIDDLVVTAPTAAFGAGRVGIFLGGRSWSSGLATSDADVLIEGDDASYVGLGLACADVDGDGALDLLTSYGEYSPWGGYGAQDWTLLLYRGGSGWSSSLGTSDADATFTFDLGVPEGDTSIYWRSFAAGDLDGDGAAEILVNMTTGSASDGTALAGDSSVWIVPGGAWSGSWDLEDVVSARVASDTEDAVTDVEVVDDIDGDGTPEIALGQGWRADTDSSSGDTVYPGRASWVSGLPAADGAAADLAFASVDGSDDEALGYDLLHADIDGDGAREVVLAAVTAPYGGSDDAGMLYVVPESALVSTGLAVADVATASVQGIWSSGYLGAALVLVDDWDGDGAPEVAAAELGGGASGAGRVHLLSGARLAAASADDPTDVDLLEWGPESSSDDAGSRLAAGDLDGDGLADLVVAAPAWGYDTSGRYTGRVYVLLTSAFGL